MKFSVLLPTRDRLEYLKCAIESVRKQGYADWEIIVSDNHSSQDVGGYVEGLRDNRIRYCRTDRSLPVTDNWNNALEKSSGEYVVMLGDDDCLLKGYFQTVSDLISGYDHPDMIYTNALLYAYPHVLPDHPDGLLQSADVSVFFHRPAAESFLLDRREAMSLVRSSLNFRMLFGYNMQYFLIGRRMIERLSGKGKFFQSPYPDYYASNTLFLASDRILIYRKPLVVIGITPKSFGYFYYNDNEKQGTDYLDNMRNTDHIQRLKSVILPGTDMNTCWLLAMETLRNNFGGEFDLKVNYRRYRLLQYLHMYYRYVSAGDADRRRFRADYDHLRRHMNTWEKTLYPMMINPAFIGSKLFPHPLQGKIQRKIMDTFGQSPAFPLNFSKEKFGNIMDVFESVDASHNTSHIFR